MRSEFIIERSGRKYVLYAGLLAEAHEKFVRLEIRTELIEAGDAPIVRSTVIGYAEGDPPDQPTIKTSGIGTGGRRGDDKSPAARTAPLEMAECVPLGSEILTRSGWKMHDQLTIGELVLAYDVEKDETRWVPLLDISHYDAAPLVTLQSRSFHVSCTPDHSWAVRGSRSASRLRKTADFNTSDRLVVAARAESGPMQLGKRLSAILGWLATDGGFRKHYVTDRYGKWGPYYKADITQTKQPYVDEIRTLLGDDASEKKTPEYEREMPSGQVSVCRESYRWTLRAALVKEIIEKTGLRTWADLPSIVLRLDHESRAAMLNAMLKGDGARHGNTWVFGKKRKPGVMEAWELLATLEGHALGGLKLKKSDGFPTRAMRSNRVVSAVTLKVMNEGAAKVWCPTTELGTWVMRQNTHITITGNTRAKSRALRDAINVGITAFEELGDSDESPPQRAENRGRTATGQRSRGGGRQNERSEPEPPDEEPESQTAYDSEAPFANERQQKEIVKLCHELKKEGQTEEEAVAAFEESLGYPINMLTEPQAANQIERLNRFKRSRASR